MNLFQTLQVLFFKKRSSKTSFILTSLPSEIGGIFLGLILSTYHGLLFFITPVITTLLFYFIYQYMIKVEIKKRLSITPWFYFRMICIQIIFIIITYILFLLVFK